MLFLLNNEKCLKKGRLKELYCSCRNSFLVGVGGGEGWRRWKGEELGSITATEWQIWRNIGEPWTLLGETLWPPESQVTPPSPEVIAHSNSFVIGTLCQNLCFIQHIPYILWHSFFFFFKRGRGGYEGSIPNVNEKQTAELHVRKWCTNPQFPFYLLLPLKAAEAAF